MMSQDKQFYVYVHRYASGPKQGEVFYVGKGKGYRSHSKIGRNTHWHNIVNKHGYDINIVARFNNEQCALSFERAFIALYGRENLCNMTDGGEGTSGNPCSNERKENIRKALIGRKKPPHTDEHKKKISESCRGRNHSDEHKKRISESHIGKIQCPHNDETKQKISRKVSGSGNGSYDFTVMRFTNECGDLFIGTKYEFRVKFGYPQSSVSRFCTSEKKYKGWIVSIDNQSL